ncbi:MAG: sulfotransferase [Desulfobacteraceae bacterium]|nr:sulfotransferase [Desulfobacteraceae bacterium]
MKKYSLFLNDTDRRTPEFKPNRDLDALLTEIHRLLKPGEMQVRGAFSNPKYPVLLVVGTPRSGTTLTMQYLASLSVFSYPSNLLARFSPVPYIGALIVKLLTDHQIDPHAEISDLCTDDTKKPFFSSNLGKTAGWASPNEFYFFWRQYIPNYDPEFLQPEEVQQIDERGIQSGLAAIESVFDKPFAAKATILPYNIPDLLRIIPKAVFLYVRRHPFYVMQSILEARIRHYGDRKGWWSLVPPEYEKIKDLDPIHQVAGQVYYTDRAIRMGLEQIPEKNQLVIDYEFLCEKPQAVYSKLREKYAEHDYVIEEAYAGPECFESRNKLRVSKKEASDIVAAYEHFSGEKLKL